MNVKYILFDLDGTIVDSHSGIFNCFKYALTCLGREIPSDEFLRKCVGPPLDYSFRNFFSLSEEEAREGVKRYRERYAVKGVFECELIGGAAECIETLFQNGYKILLATSKPEPFAVKILERFDLMKYFTAVCGSDFEVRLKTKTDVVEEVLTRADAKNKEEIVIVGDRKYDVIGGKNAGIHTVAVRVGFAERGELEESGADFIADDFSSLTDFFLKGQDR